MNSQLKSILTHITLIGWIIALILNNTDKDETTAFYLRQTLGIYLLGLIGTFIPVLRLVIALIAFILWVISLIGSINKDMKPVPVIGQYFQEWFKGIG